jgi:gluconolactonase
MLDEVEVRLVASGLKFPEGPIAEPDGSVLVVEVDGGALVRTSPDGVRSVVADVGAGGANGAAVGPDGAVYVASNGGFAWFTMEDGSRVPVGFAEGWERGAIHRVDLRSGECTEVFTHSDGKALGSLNDVVFDSTGGCYVVDTLPDGYIHYAVPGEGKISVATDQVVTPNGAGLSPDGTRLYVSETYTGRIRVFQVTGPGKLVEDADLFRHPGAGGEGYFFDGLTIDSRGNVIVADLTESGVRVISPEGEELGVVKTLEHDVMVTCAAFGGLDLRTLYITAGASGKLYAAQWPWPGLALNV